MKRLLYLLCVSSFSFTQAYCQYPFRWIKVENSEFDLLYKQFLIEKSEKINEVSAKYKTQLKNSLTKWEYDSNMEFYKGPKFRVVWFKDHKVFFGESGTIWRLKIYNVEKGLGLVAPEELVEYGLIVDPWEYKQ
jgi:hypothetical protein